MVWSKKGPLTTFFLPFIHIFKIQLQLWSKRPASLRRASCFSYFLVISHAFFVFFCFFLRGFYVNLKFEFDTVDGWNPSPPRMMIIPLFIGFEPSQVVVWDFSHQQYHNFLSLFCCGFQLLWSRWRRSIFLLGWKQCTQRLERRGRRSSQWRRCSTEAARFFTGGCWWTCGISQQQL